MLVHLSISYSVLFSRTTSHLDKIHMRHPFYCVKRLLTVILASFVLLGAALPQSSLPAQRSEGQKLDSGTVNFDPNGEGNDDYSGTATSGGNQIAVIFPGNVNESWYYWNEETKKYEGDGTICFHMCSCGEMLFYRSDGPNGTADQPGGG